MRLGELSISESSGIFTVKLGGKTLDEDRVLAHLAEDISKLSWMGYRFLIVHGGGNEISLEMKRLGIEPVKVSGLRVTDDEIMSLVERVMNRVNDQIRLKLESYGLKGERVIGADGLLACEKLSPLKASEGDEEKLIDLGRVGEVKKVFPEKLDEVFGTGKIPVIAPYGMGGDGLTLNINADTAAGSIAGACSDGIIFITDVDGVLVPGAQGEVIADKLSISDVQELRAKGVIHGGMIPKVEACIHAIESGVRSARIVNGFADHPLLRALSDDPIGTVILP